MALLTTFFVALFFSWTSLIACSWHLTNSVGHNVKDEKKAAKNPAHAFPTELNSDTVRTSEIKLKIKFK